ncbi:hypothetical protein MAC_04543 [Metarhizium acridum CQMa 102]|uniref:Uncharacterized protein n=1 Tax=Metarhizium acridum (strain CQMa 102) TaxID=655827 RepID=E9E3U5_METAQ|nr:uncharacterized protein MAC_04543 [Metarhizium acridum CQMa 102]EFY89357.1 hypothetical protein MAC_04543 [Metarhizium acridum CQMa 102]
MADHFRIWTDRKNNSVEGHTRTGILTFENKVIWGPVNCHDNTERLRVALHEADHRFDMILTPKQNTVEGHTRFISVRNSAGRVTLDRLSTHDNMDTLVAAVNAARAIAGPPG